MSVLSSCELDGKKKVCLCTSSRLVASSYQTIGRAILDCYLMIDHSNHDAIGTQHIKTTYFATHILGFSHVRLTNICS